MSGSSCLIANSLLHIALIRHGSVFQVIDPWLTSWYSNFAIETFVRDLALGLTVGEAYANGIKHVGIGYLTNQWWWDIFENVVYYGDPDLVVFMPSNIWEKPEPLWFGEMIGGHTPHGTDGHPHNIKSTQMKEWLIIGAAIGGIGACIGAGAYRFMTRPKRPKMTRKERREAKRRAKLEKKAKKKGKRTGNKRAKMKAKGSKDRKK